MNDLHRTMSMAKVFANQKPHADSTLTAQTTGTFHRTPVRPYAAWIDCFDGGKEHCVDSAIEQFRAAAHAQGIALPDTIHADGKLHRYSTSGRSSDDSGWYVLHLNDIAAGVFGDWRTGLQSTWCSKGANTMTPAERTAMQDRLQAAQRERDADRNRTQQQAAFESQRRWKAATPATMYPYLSAKGIGAHGSRVERDHLLIAMHDPAGTVRSLQTIAPDGSKRFLPGGAVRGLMYLIGRPSGSVIVCEGFATGASIHEATGSAVAVAFNCGNLEAAAKAIRAQFPCLSIVIAADDDWCTEGNPGRTTATEAALAVGGVVVLPCFPAQRSKKATDFNDLHQLAGPAAVRACFAEVEVQ